MTYEPSLGRIAYSEVLEDYLKHIFLLSQKQKKVTTTDLARTFAVAPATVTQTLKRLSQLELVEHVPYYGVKMTPKGERIARELLRHHRLLELYLEKALGLSWEKVHAEAERLEHVISEEVEESIARFLGEPLYDPHGAPIPSRALHLPSDSTCSLSDLQEGETATIVAIEDEKEDLLLFARDHGLFPGRDFLLVSRLEEEVKLEILGGGPLSLPLLFASWIWVRRNESCANPLWEDQG